MSDFQKVGAGFLLILAIIMVLMCEHGSKLVNLQRRVGQLESQSDTK